MGGLAALLTDDLSSLQFDASLKPSGPTKMEVGLFLNGSSTAYATFDFSPTPTFATYTFNFTPLVDANNVTSATFSFFGWNAVATGGGIALDNVITNGAITPEPANGWFALLPAALALGGYRQASPESLLFSRPFKSAVNSLGKRV